MTTYVPKTIISLAEFNKMSLKDRLATTKPVTPEAPVSDSEDEEEEDSSSDESDREGLPIHKKGVVPIIKCLDDVAEEATVSPVRDNGKFYIQNCKYMLTYKGHFRKSPKNRSMDEAKWIDWFKKNKLNKEGQELMFCRMANEYGKHKGEKKAYKHCHVIIRVKIKLDSKDASYFDYMGIHPHIRLIKNTTIDWNTVLNYISKDDPDCKDLEAAPSIACKVMKEASLIDAFVNNVVRPSDALGVKLLFESRERAPLRDNTLKSPTEIQLRLEEICINEKPIFPGDPVNWIFDPPGQCGKSAFQKHMRSKYPGECFWISDASDKKAVATILHEHFVKKDNDKCKYMFVNLERGVDEFKSLYKIIEMLSDAEATATRYTGGSFEFPATRIIIFANFPPDLNKMSRGRIIPWTITGPVGRDNREMVPYIEKEHKSLAIPELNSDMSHHELNSIFDLRQREHGCGGVEVLSRGSKSIRERCSSNKA